jgi:uncharacterized protein
MSDPKPGSAPRDRRPPARRWLARLRLPAGVVDRVCGIIASISFKGAGVPEAALSREGRVVRDADRLDALGAIGIARTFAYGGKTGRPIHEPGARPVLHRSAAAYLRHRGTAINHFHEKLLLLKGRLRTAAARKLARGRHAFMVQYLKRFHAEWAGAR